MSFRNMTEHEPPTPGDVRIYMPLAAREATDES